MKYKAHLYQKCFFRNTSITTLIFFILTLFSALSLSEEVQKDKKSAFEKAREQYINQVSKIIEGERLYFFIETPEPIKTGKSGTIRYQIKKREKVSQLNWQVTLSIYKNNKFISDYSMKEQSSTESDTEGDETIYSRNFVKSIQLDEKGKYQIVIEARSLNMEGRKVSHIGRKDIYIIPNPEIKFTGEIIESLIDSDDNGLANSLRVTLPFKANIGNNEKYRVWVRLGNKQYNGIGDIITNTSFVINNKKHLSQARESNIIAFEKTIIDSSHTAVIVEFKGKDIAKKHQSGKLRLVNVVIMADDEYSWGGFRKFRTLVKLNHILLKYLKGH
ncbi:hypothetical protein [Colwellia sp. Arc7-D]|uniref:hypothetical protein n=1 Tax=Colwellia sp. Arc7-D TaxID=2161872 RepID=UPI000D3B56E1|nr:hypothetical protein [Colwellia sp. Arc7-D]AWB58263.1 hypothetical protein DBO93_12245 [Colwellia sp. Arc7-D]